MSFTNPSPGAQAKREAADAEMRARWKNHFTKKVKIVKVKIVSLCGCGQIKSAPADLCAKCSYLKRQAAKPPKIKTLKLKLLKVIEIEEAPSALPDLPLAKEVLEIPVVEDRVKSKLELKPFREDATVTQLLAKAGFVR